jgi:hypothetical protein
MRTRARGLPQISIIVLTLAAVAIHLSRALVNPHVMALFTLNAVGYLVLLALLNLPIVALGPFQPLVRRALIGYAGLTVALFVVWGLMKNEWPAIGFADKLIELTLIGLLINLERQPATVSTENSVESLAA